MADKRKKKSQLSTAFTNDVIASKYYRDSVTLRTKGAWRDAGDLLIKCAEVYLHIKMLVEAACLFTEAAEAYMHIDKGEALLAYQKAIKLYCDVGKFSVGGKLEQRVAYINLYAQHWEDAALHFRKAANFLSGDKLLDQSDHCIEKSAECLIMLGEYKEASNLYQMIAKSCVNSNLRRFNSLDHLLMSILCLMAIPEVVRAEPQVLKTPVKNKSTKSGKSGNSPATPRDDEDDEAEQVPLYQTKYEALFSMNEQFERIDYLWRRSKEKLFVRNIIRARTEVDIHAFADHLYYWSNIRPLNSTRTILLKVPMMEIKQILEAAAKAEAERIIAEEAAALKRAKKKNKQDRLDAGSVAGSSFQDSQTSSFQEGRSSVGSDLNAKEGRGSITEDNTKMNARASIEGGGGRTSLQDGRASVNSGDGRDSLSMGRNSVTK